MGTHGHIGHLSPGSLEPPHPKFWELKGWSIRWPESKVYRKRGSRGLRKRRQRNTFSRRNAAATHQLTSRSDPFGALIKLHSLQINCQKGPRLVSVAILFPNSALPNLDLVPQAAIPDAFDAPFLGTHAGHPSRRSARFDASKGSSSKS